MSNNNGKYFNDKVSTEFKKNQRKNIPSLKSFDKFNIKYYPPIIFGGTGCPSSPPVGGVVGFGCTIFGVDPSPPQFEVFELEGFENNPNNIKSN